jgi:hypothetical protein
MAKGIKVSGTVLKVKNVPKNEKYNQEAHTVLYVDVGEDVLLVKNKTGIYIEEGEELDHSVSVSSFKDKIYYGIKEV